MEHSTRPNGRPPTGLSGLLAVIGPGIVVVGSVIGAGELINTPLQAASFGFVLLWAVVLSCVIKCLLQMEIGRHCVVHNRTTVEALNACPGPRVRGTSWAPLLYMAGYTISLVTSVGIIGALAGLMQAIVPASGTSPYSAAAWGAAVVALAAILLRSGAYGHLEKLVAILVGVFCAAVVLALAFIQGTSFRIQGGELLSGMRFSLGDEPRRAAFAVVSLMGALGTTANELFMYPYWLREKGYGRDLPHLAGEAWLGSARRWLRGLRIDVGFATFIATVATVAFYLLGAAVLHRQQIEPQGLAVVEEISQVFTQSQGAWSYGVFMAGAFCTLFSTLVVATAATGRMWADVLCSMKLVDRADEGAVRQTHKAVQLVYLAGMLAAFLAFQRYGAPPGRLVVAGQFFAGVFNTPLMMFGICCMALQTDARVRMRPWTAAALLASVAVIALCIAAGVAV
ncbi:MAG: Nramp family divalent metal transporter, partial [Pirellulales bacterium]|nr:Nramp family divalent metal transporter [Pirellulales bacterium]